jgi:hypothetical protein
MAKRPCLDCGVLLEGGTRGSSSRCGACLEKRGGFNRGAPSPERRQYQASRYDYAWRKLSKAIREAIPEGAPCPGWGVPPHPIARSEWTVDHDLGPLCRRCNGRKGNRVGPAPG